jgi:hypothetical protein
MQIRNSLFDIRGQFGLTYMLSPRAMAAVSTVGYSEGSAGEAASVLQIRECALSPFSINTPRNYHFSMANGHLQFADPQSLGKRDDN